MTADMFADHTDSKWPKVSELRDGTQIDGFYAVQEASLLTTAQGKNYIRMVLSDATGSIVCNFWDASPEIYKTFSAGDVVRARGTAETYRGKLQLRISALRCAEEDEFNPSDFVASTTADMNFLDSELKRLVNSVKDKDYNALLAAFFDDDALVSAFRKAPAAKENHHAYVGGLMEHTISIARICESFAATTATELNADLLMAGALLHDIGKIDELGMGTVIEYTDVGKLLGHLAVGTIMVEKRAAQLPDFPNEKKWLVQHMILSHHGKREYGSPVLPCIPEALALHHVDNLDAKTVAARRIIDSDTDDERRWTDRSWMLETQLFKKA